MPKKSRNRSYAVDKIFDAFLSLSRDGIYIVGEDGGFLEVNPAYCKLLGYSREELLALSIPDVEVNTPPDAIFRRISASKAAGSSRFETIHCRKDGSSVNVEISATYIHVDDRGLFLSIVRDMTSIHLEETEKIRALALQQSVQSKLQRLKNSLISATRIISGKMSLEDTLREALSTARRLSEAQYAVIAFVEHGKVTSFFHEGLSPEILQDLGNWLDARERTLLFQDKIIVRVSRSSMDPRFATFWKQFPDMRDLIRAPVLHDDQILGTIWLVNKADGNPFTENDQEIIESLSAHVAVSLNNARMYEQFRIFNQDLEYKIQEKTRQLKEALTRVEVANDAKTRFLAGMSHELRTPMNVIIGFSDVLAEEYVGPLNDKQREYVGDIQDSANRMILLIDDILNVTKIDSGKMVLHLEVIRIGDLLEDSLILVREKAGKHHVSVRIEMESETSNLEIVADSQNLKLVLYNLLSNAIKFSPEGGIVILKTAYAGPDAETIRIIVEDAGIGISPDHLEKIFEDFFQVQDGIQDKTRGTGLGLPLVKRLVEMHGGRAWAESNGIGKGGRFVVELPVTGP